MVLGLLFALWRGSIAAGGSIAESSVSPVCSLLWVGTVTSYSTVFFLDCDCVIEVSSSDYPPDQYLYMREIKVAYTGYT